MSSSSSSKSGKAGGGGSKQHDYFGSVAGVICQGRLDYLWGLTLDGKLIWPTVVVIDASLDWATVTNGVTFAAGAIIAYDGRIWRAATGTTSAPPHPDWELFRVNRTDVGVGNPYKFTVEGWGDVYLYWGTDDQALDATNEKFLSDNGHPPYRHRAVLAFKDFLFGTERQSIPNAVLLGGRVPSQTIVTGDAADEDDEWRVNPWCVILELLTHPVIGLGLPDSLFDATSWQAAADWALGNHSLAYISPIYDRQQQVRSIVADLLQYSDGYLYWTANGAIAAGHRSHGDEPPTFTDANTVDIHDLVEPVNWKADSWRDTTNATVVNYNDINYAFNSVPAKASNLFNRVATRRVQSRTIDRPFIIYADQAAAIAAEDAKINGEPKFSGTLTVRAEKAVAITAGTLFQLTDDSQEISRACRCTKKTLSAPPVGTAKLEFETERGLAELPYSATPSSPTPGQPPPPARITNFEIVQIPPQLTALDLDYQFVCLAARNNGLTSRLGVWWRNDDTDAFQQLIRQSGFAVFGTVNTGINTATVTDEVITTDSLAGETYELASQDVWGVVVEYSADGSGPWTEATAGTDYTVDGPAGTVTILADGSIADTSYVRVSYAKSISVAIASETPTQDIERISASLTDDEITNNTLLLFLFKAADPKQFEILSVKSVTAAGGGNYTIATKRALYGTQEGGNGTYEFTDDDRAFLIFRAGLTPFTHQSFADVAAAEGTATFRLTPATAWIESAVDDVYDAGDNPQGKTTEITYSFLDPYPPAVEWTGIFADDGAGGAFTAVSDLTTVFPAGTRFRLIARITDQNADLSAYTISYFLGGNTGVLVAQETVSPTGAISRTFEFTLDKQGAYRVVLSARDRTARVTDQHLTDVGGTDEAFILIETDSATDVSAPVITVSGIIGGKRPTILTITCATGGASIFYKIQNASTTPPLSTDGGWTAYTAPTSFHMLTTQVIYAYAEKSGLNDSPVVSYT